MAKTKPDPKGALLMLLGLGALAGVLVLSRVLLVPLTRATWAVAGEDDVWAAVVICGLAASISATIGLILAIRTRSKVLSWPLFPVPVLLAFYFFSFVPGRGRSMEFARELDRYAGGYAGDLFAWAGLIALLGTLAMVFVMLGVGWLLSRLHVELRWWGIALVWLVSWSAITTLTVLARF